nr:MAG TPA: hypothetical protein [Caudoviricetes sp.]
MQLLLMIRYLYLVLFEEHRLLIFYLYRVCLYYIL